MCKIESTVNITSKRILLQPIVNIFEKFRIQYVRDQLSKPPDYTPGSHIVDFPEVRKHILVFLSKCVRNIQKGKI